MAGVANEAPAEPGFGGAVQRTYSGRLYRERTLCCRTGLVRRCPAAARGRRR